MKNRTLPSLERRFILLFVVLILFLSGLGAYFSQYYSNQFREDIAMRNQSLSHSIRGQVQQLLLMHVGELRGLKEFLENPRIFGDVEQLELEHTLVSHGLIESIEILDSDGSLYCIAYFLAGLDFRCLSN